MTSHQDTPTARTRLARNLRRWRLARGLSQDELSAGADLSQTFLSQIENGSRNVSLDNIEKLANVLQIDVTALLAP
ncbi:helix-turn-helix domain-containing protein [Herbaspirillum sp. RV1423]|uniref:helix-turn-helix domain-containing protein n=1 Tax=Herbaspirillum sp. RV1423 TaxID=1443993 RepID=UPI00055698CF|nr:helix-turn-helix transcriptional regulator [Herbaspirillum sp. RV1423]